MLTRIVAMALVGTLFLVTSCDNTESVSPQPLPLLASVTMIVSDMVQRPVAGARAELKTGVDAGTFAISSADGTVTIAGHTLPSGSLTVRISKEGLRAVDQTYRASPTDTTFASLVSLVALTPLDLAGENLLTIEADSLCEGLPVAVTKRTFDASIAPTPNPSYFSIGLGGASFFRDFNLLGVFVAADAARFEVYLAPLEEEPIVERLSQNEYVAFDGEATAEASQFDEVISGPFRGSISYCPATPATLSFLCPVSPSPVSQPPIG